MIRMIGHFVYIFWQLLHVCIYKIAERCPNSKKCHTTFFLVIRDWCWVTPHKFFMITTWNSPRTVRLQKVLLFLVHPGRSSAWKTKQLNHTWVADTCLNRNCLFILKLIISPLGNLQTSQMYKYFKRAERSWPRLDVFWSSWEVKRKS